MRLRARTGGALLRTLLVLILALLLPSGVEGARAAAGAHCTSTGETPHRHGGQGHLPSHAPEPNKGPALGADHACPHCPHGECPTDAHCLAGGAGAPATSGALPTLSGGSLVGPGWLSDRPLSANPTPPIPPPQAVL